MEKQLKSIKFPGLDDVYVIPETDISNKADNIQVKSGSIIITNNSAHTPLKGFKLFGKTIQNGTPTPEAPVPLESVGNVNVAVTGKNLLNTNGLQERILNGVTVTPVYENGYLQYINCNGTPTQSTAGFNMYMDAKAGVSYVLNGSQKISDISKLKLQIVGVGGDNSQSGLLFTPTEDTTLNVYVWFTTGKKFNNEKLYPMIRFASITDDTYEPYKETQIFPITGKDLPGIPVSSGGNYTDSTGQQWVCDEVDFARGKYVQRIRKVIAKNLTVGYRGPKVFHAEFTTGFPAKPAKANGEKADIMCDSLPVKSGNDQYNYGSSCIALGTTGVGYISFDGATSLAQVNTKLAEKDITVMYVLAEEKTTDLSAEQLTAYAAMHTNYPNTTIFNDCAAHMEVKYYTPNTAVQMVHSPADEGKVLAIDEHGCVVLKDVVGELTNEILGGAW